MSLGELGEDVTSHLGAEHAGLVTVRRTGRDVQHVAGAGLDGVGVEAVADAAGEDEDRAVSARLESQPCEKGRFRIAPGL